LCAIWWLKPPVSVTALVQTPANRPVSIQTQIGALDLFKRRARLAFPLLPRATHAEPDSWDLIVTAMGLNAVSFRLTPSIADVI